MEILALLIIFLLITICILISYIDYKKTDKSYKVSYNNTNIGDIFYTYFFPVHPFDHGQFFRVMVVDKKDNWLNYYYLDEEKGLESGGRVKKYDHFYEEYMTFEEMKKMLSDYGHEEYFDEYINKLNKDKNEK